MNASDSDEKVRVPSIRLSDVKCLHTTSRDEDWYRSSIFHTYISHEGKSYKMIYKIDVPLLSLKLILIHNYMMLPELIKWLSLLTQYCLVSIEMFSYQNHLWYDVLDMNTAHIFLGRLWLHNFHVTNFGWSNTHEFKFN